MNKTLGLSVAVGLSALIVGFRGDLSATTDVPVSKALFFASDGMRPDLMEQYAADGSLPTYRALMQAGVRGANGLLQAFPPNTGTGWYTLATGTWPGVPPFLAFCTRPLLTSFARFRL